MLLLDNKQQKSKWPAIDSNGAHTYITKFFNKKVDSQVTWPCLNVPMKIVEKKNNSTTSIFFIATLFDTERERESASKFYEFDVLCKCLYLNFLFTFIDVDVVCIYHSLGYVPIQCARL